MKLVTSSRSWAAAAAKSRFSFLVAQSSIRSCRVAPVPGMMISWKLYGSPRITPIRLASPGVARQLWKRTGMVAAVATFSVARPKLKKLSAASP